MAGIRARSRPRIRSANFRRLYFVLVREAAFRILLPHGSVPSTERALRRLLLVSSRGRILSAGVRQLELYPERRTWPPS